MTDEQISSLLELCEKATPGPWESILPEGKYYGTRIINPDGRYIELWGFGLPTFRVSAREAEGFGMSVEEASREVSDSHYEDEQDYVDSVLIAAASTALPQALRELQEAKRLLRWVLDEAAPNYENKEARAFLSRPAGGEKEELAKSYIALMESKLEPEQPTEADIKEPRR